MSSRIAWLLGAMAVAILVLGAVLAWVVLTQLPQSATVEVQVGRWTLPARGIIHLDEEDLPSGLEFLLPWRDPEATVHVTTGSVESIDDDEIRIRPYVDGGDEGFKLADDVGVFRGLLPSSPANLKPGDIVVLLSLDRQVQFILAGGRLVESS